ncbi:dihydrolipoamide acetyltransferase family protein [Streptomyces sp. IMTB 1903]|uniref:dihydrolipoamide acetyltransferase family protein n=1 Tax=Streptomyces sp. IMTB 1903 TaxID=1776680 RepID=UPI00075D804C|nr:dihydrolipoamide acetyltransferase family protein [Streptomyces sp. IMTB 1903]
MGEFTMPSLGADMDEGTLVEWLVTRGAEVARGDVIAVVETAKSTIEVECFESGTVTEFLIEPGTTVAVGTPLAVIAPAGPAPAPGPPGPLPVPAEAVPAEAVPATPLVRHQAAVEGVSLQAVHGTGRGGRIRRADVAEAARSGPARVIASPLARRLAESLGVDLSTVRGTGSRGAVKADDVRAAAGTGGGKPARRGAVVEPAGPRPAATQTPAARPAGDRLAIARLMSRAKREIPHYYLSTTVDLAAALEWMHRRNSTLPVTERLVPAALLLKAVARAAREVPELNGHWREDRFVPAAGVRLGTAVSLRGGGLVAPALADVDRMPLADVMAAMKDLVLRARRGRLRASETADPTLTVTNLGDQGVESVLGVIYPPQVAMVGLGRVTDRPVAVDGMLAVHPTVTATLSADHRASDGATGARFLTALDRLLQHPEDL